MPLWSNQPVASGNLAMGRASIKGTAIHGGSQQSAGNLGGNICLVIDFRFCKTSHINKCLTAMAKAQITT